jgi:hypothetical protein
MIVVLNHLDPQQAPSSDNKHKQLNNETRYRPTKNYNEKKQKKTQQKNKQTKHLKLLKYLSHGV